MVLHAAVVKHVAAYLRAPFDFLLSGFDFRLFRHSALQFHVVELRPQKSHRILAVVELRARLGVLDENLARLTGVRVLVVVAQPHARLHLVYVLTSGTTASERVPSDVGGIDFHFD